MSLTRRTLLPAILSASLIACSSSAPVSDEVPVETTITEEEGATTEDVVEETSFEEKLQQIAAGDHRSEDNIARNQYRHPVETLMFFGLTPESTVVELNPGTGWYTEILAPALAENGKLVVAYPDVELLEGFYANMVAGFEQKFQDAPEIYGAVERAYLHHGHNIDFGEPESADLVVTFRNIHGWHNRAQLADILAEAHAVLKPGGILGVVQHRANDDADLEAIKDSGYLPQPFVIELIEAQGFELVEASEINANPADTKDHPEGVWTLPPSLRLGDQDREKYIEIGESDRMTLKFKKVAE